QRIHDVKLGLSPHGTHARSDRMALGTGSTCDPASRLSATAKTMAIGLVSITIRSRGNLTGRYHYTAATVIRNSQSLTIVPSVARFEAVARAMRSSRNARLPSWVSASDALSVGP